MFLGEVFIKNMRSLDVGSQRAGDNFFSLQYIPSDTLWCFVEEV